MAPECFNLHLQAISMECYDDHRQSGRPDLAGREVTHVRWSVQVTEWGVYMYNIDSLGSLKKDGMYSQSVCLLPHIR